MSIAENPKFAVSVDADGVLYERFPFQYNALKHKLLHGSIIHEFPLERHTYNRDFISDSRLGAIESKDLEGQSKRKVYSQAKNFLKDLDLLKQQLDYAELSDLKVDFNTGRANHRQWRDETIESLKRNGIYDYFDDFFFKPEGVKSWESKREAVEHRLQDGYSVIHIDDNPEDAFYVAGLDHYYPGKVFVYIVQDFTPGEGFLYSRAEAEQFPNVARILRKDMNQGINLVKRAQGFLSSSLGL